MPPRQTFVAHPCTEGDFRGSGRGGAGDAARVSSGAIPLEPAEPRFRTPTPDGHKRRQPTKKRVVEAPQESLPGPWDGGAGAAGQHRVYVGGAHRRLMGLGNNVQ